MPMQDTPQTSKQHAVPQNVMDVEFKLIGDLTMRQFAYLLINGIIAYVVYLSVIGIFKWPLVLFFCILGVGLAFGSYQERGLDIWIRNFVTAMYMPTQRIWHKEPEIPQAFLQARLDVVKSELITLAPTQSRRKLEKFLEYGIHDDEVDPLDIPENEYILKVRQAFAQYDTPEEPVYAPQPAVGVYNEPQVSDIETVEVEAPESSPPPEEPMIKPVPITPKEDKETEQEKQTSVIEPAVIPEIQKKPTPSVEMPKQKKISIPKPKRKPQPQPISEQYLSLDVITPDRHSGRRFSRILPSDGEIILPIRGERVIQTDLDKNMDQDIKEKTEKLQALLSQITGDEDQPKRKMSIPLKTNVPPAPQGNTVSPQIQKSTPAKPTPIPPLPENKAPTVHYAGSSTKIINPPKAEEKPEPIKAKIDQIKTELKDTDKNSKEYKKKESLLKSLSEKLQDLMAGFHKEKKEKPPKPEQPKLGIKEELTKLKNELKNTDKNSAEFSMKESRVKELEAKLERSEKEYGNLQRQLNELQNKMAQNQNAQEPEEKKAVPASNTKGKDFNRVFTQAPNVLSGIARSSDGGILPGILVIVKDSQGEPVRAFKTNELGEFVLSTPLDNGMYTVEVSESNNLDETFDIISVEVNGGVIPPLQLLGS